jgi:hypothetical protein
MKLWQGCFSTDDFKRMEAIRLAHDLESEAEALRYAISEQAARCQLPTTVRLASLYDDAKRSCVEMNGRWRRANVNTDLQEEVRLANATREKLKRWSFRVDDVDLSRVDRIATKHNLKKRAEAVRFALYVQGTIDGFTTFRRSKHREHHLASS